MQYFTKKGIFRYKWTKKLGMGAYFGNLSINENIKDDETVYITTKDAYLAVLTYSDLVTVF